MTWREYDERVVADRGDARARRTRPATASRSSSPTARACTRRCSRARRPGSSRSGIGSRAGEREVDAPRRADGRARRCSPSSRPARRRRLAERPDRRRRPVVPQLHVGHDRPAQDRHARPGALVRVPRVRATGSRTSPPTTCSSSALPAPFGFGLWTAHFTPDDPRRAVRRVRRASTPSTVLRRDRALPRHRARRGVDPVRDDAQLARDRALRPLVAARACSPAARWCPTSAPRSSRSAPARRVLQFYGIERDRRAVVHDARRSAGAAGCAPRAA